MHCVLYDLTCICLSPQLLTSLDASRIIADCPLRVYQVLQNLAIADDTLLAEMLLSRMVMLARAAEMQ